MNRFHLVGLLALLAAACSDTKGSAPAGSPEARVAELVEALKPISKTVTSDISDAHFHRGNELVAELSAAGPEVGAAARRALQSRSEKDVQVERGLLAVAARADTAGTQTLLENLVTEYGPSLDLRTEAALLLAEVAPESALERIESMVLRETRNQTTPPVEFLVRAWVIACEKTGRSPVPVLCDVATNLLQEDSARIRAVAELGNYKDPRAEKALRAILVESTGNGYLRRKAAQGLRDTLPNETACDIFRNVADKEADLNFLAFLMDLLDKNCGS